MIELETHSDGGLDHDLKLVRRRRMTGLVGGTTVAALAAPRKASPLTRTAIVRGDIRRSFGTSSGVARGVPFAIRLRLLSANSGRPLTDHAVYLWHCDRDGSYSLYSPGLTGENYLRGMQGADSAGWVRFETIFPGAYPGRWPHVHFQIFGEGRLVQAGELTLPADACERAYAVPGYERSRGQLDRSLLGGPLEMACVTGDVRRGLVATRSIMV